MRIGLMLAAMLVPIGSAAADNPRYLPAVGTTATFRLLVTTDSGGNERTVGHIYRVAITANDGTTAEGTLTPLALVWHCPAGDTSITCKQAQYLPNASREGDLLTAPLPADISGELGKVGKMTLRDLLHVTQVYPLPGLQDLGEIEQPRIGSLPLAIQTTAQDCDEAALRPFFPFGSAARATVVCKMTVEVSRSRLAAVKDARNTHDVTYELSFAGHEHIAVPAGAYEVAVVKFKSTADSGDGAVTEGQWEFVENLGFSAKFSSLTRFPKSTNTSRIVRELIKIEP
jgi:hypothetical protein